MTYLIDAIRRRLRRVSSRTPSDTPRSPPSSDAYAVLDALAKVQLAQDSLTQAQSALLTIDLPSFLRQWAKRPVRLILRVPGAPTVTSPSPTPVNDQAFDIEVEGAQDAQGVNVEDLGPFTWTSAGLDGIVFSDVAGRAGDTTRQHVSLPRSTTGAPLPDFMVTADDPGGASGSLACHPVAGGPTSLRLGLVATP